MFFQRVTATRAHNKNQTITSVGQWIHTITLLIDMTIPPINKNRLNHLRNGISWWYARYRAAHATAAHTAAWSEGKGAVGRWSMINISVFQMYPSGLCLSTKNWITILVTATKNALAATYNAHIFLTVFLWTIALIYQNKRINGKVRTIPSAKTGALATNRSWDKANSFACIKKSFHRWGSWRGSICFSIRRNKKSKVSLQYIMFM